MAAYLTTRGTGLSPFPAWPSLGGGMRNCYLVFRDVFVVLVWQYMPCEAG